MNGIRDNNGYSLVEIMLAVALFAFVMGIALDIFQSVNRSQRSAIAAQNIQENLRYALEVMSKEIRQAVRSDGDCKNSFTGITPATIKRVYSTGSTAGLSAENVLFFKKIEKNTNDEICVAYFVDSSRIKIIRVNKTSNAVIANGYITPANIDITKFTFSISDNPIIVFQPTDKIQPRINLQIGAEMASGQLRQPILIQTTISSRMYGN
jgi:prepilin-type N-terminal cleavage/methylation domain-containing protein